MGIFKDIKKAFKGDKDYQAGKAKKKAARKAKLKPAKERSAKKRAENKAKAKSMPVNRTTKPKKTKGPGGKPINQRALDKKVQERRAANKKKTAEKKVGKKWTKAVAKQKKTGGPTMTELIKRRNAAKKGSSEYASAQNQINKSYGSKKVHKADPKKAVSKPKPKSLPKAKPKSLPKAKAKKPIGQTDEVKAKSGPAGPSKKHDAKPGQKSTMNRNKSIGQKLKDKLSKHKPTTGPAGWKDKYPPAKFEEGGMVDSYGGGGKVSSSGLFNWPSKNARGKK